MKLDVMLSEVRQSKKNKYCMIHSYMTYLEYIKFIETENRMIVGKGCGAEKLGVIV